MTLMWLDHDNLLLNTIPILVADPTRSILCHLILNPGITDETLVLESIIHLEFLSKSRLIESKQESIFSFRGLVYTTHTYEPTLNQNIR